MTTSRNPLSQRKHPWHCVDKLREQARQHSQRAFVARGANTTRCPSCLMSEFACFCHKRTPQPSPVQFTLLYHYTEIHKPTNSGRLIADLFPEHTQAYIWSRTEPEQALLERIKRTNQRSIILYPETEKRLALETHINELPDCGRLNEESPLHVIVLDATWRLASKMLHQSRWLDDIPTLAISEDTQRSFKVRHAKHENQFATAEVVAMLLAQAGYPDKSLALAQYYQIFNDHSLISRRRGNSSEI